MTSKIVVDFLLEKTHSEKKHGYRRGFYRKKLQQQRHSLEIVKDFPCEAKKPENLQRFRILGIFHFSCFSFFFLFSSFLFSCFFIFLVFFFFIFPFFHFFFIFCLFFFLSIFQSSEQTPNPKKSSNISSCKNDDFLV